ncbi:hypothetical protein FRC14_008272 [Serendipita sp. 396]|nr:hypothetical protein FRC14_008272 [Serendipita sp. 396]KAG8777318.1 hypothetical protein FRC15_011419 [Serendipita sp. 397]KAG8793010.1 hypothetical protein FRC16_011177 [Serendipita sp. 398]KAG8818912.1 hypothetical protein FRC18_012273 [Serendipita sp. 400]KAG8819913.1 hypothetical protein FRC19_009391 [Serendipita sp. 401]KAG8863239.1 hypothetical protein FRC20_010823 [Serendipita sp. 405]KAG9053013.1 hypothetical protein FS842_008901 [Serendipita sp. 407]
MEDRVVIVLGSVATGKTTLINLATQRGDIGVSHGIKPGTTKVECIRSKRPLEGRNVIFIDTPGFDALDDPDEKVVETIMDFLSTNNLKVDTILYLYSLASNRMTNKSFDRLQLLTNIWQGDIAQHLVIVTTMWNEINPNTGEAREKEFRSRIESEAITNGCTFERFDCTTDSVSRILRHSFQRVTNMPLYVNEIAGSRKPKRKPTSLLQRILASLCMS